MYRVELIQAKDAEEWDAFVMGCRAGSVYHTTLWGEVLREAYGCVPYYLGCRDASGAFVAAMPLVAVESRITGFRLCCVPCAHVCPPLVADQDVLDAMLSKARGLAGSRGSSALEIRCTRDYPLQFDGMHAGETEYATYTLDLTRGPDDIFRGFHRSCIRRPLAKTHTNGVSLHVGDSAEDLRAFHDLYVGMRRSKGLLPQPLGFFQAMWNTLQPLGHLHLFHARVREEIVASMIFLQYGGVWTYEYGASSPRGLMTYPNHFLLWTAIQRAIESGAHLFDFGRNELSNVGLSTFKRRWGASEVRLQSYTTRPSSRHDRIRGDRMLRVAMEKATAISPAFLCRWGGVALYRHLI